MIADVLIQANAATSQPAATGHLMSCCCCCWSVWLDLSLQQ